MRHTTALGLALAALPATAFAAAPDGWAPLLSAQELAEIRDSGAELTIIRVTGDHAAGHIPGSVYSPYGAWRGSADNPGALLPVSEYQAEAARIGVQADTPTVVVHDGASPTDMGAAARVYWTLKSLGVQDLALLNGGYDAWEAAELPTETGTTDPAPSEFTAEWTDDWYIPTDEVVAMVESGDARLIDGRPQSFFEGLTWSIARPGTVQGAENLQFAQFFEGDKMVDPTRVKAIAAAQGLQDAPVTVSFCNTGHWAAINWFALSELAEVDNTRLYAASMAEYTAEGHALDNAPGRLSYLWLSTKRWVADLF